MSDIASAASRMTASDRRTQLLQIALKVFSQKGFNGATTKEIAAQAGITEAMIFRHFPNKQALYKAVLESQIGCPGFEKWMAMAKDCMERGDDAGLFRLLATAMISSYRDDARLERILLFAALEGHEQGLEHFRSFSIPIGELLREYIVRRQKAGALRDDVRPTAIIGAMGGMAHRYAMLTQLFGFKVEATDDQVVEAFTDILMNGIKAK
jgi:TetR/AcrR family transcriptional regulator